MKDIIEFFTGANLWAWLFIITCSVGFAALSSHQKKGALGQ